MTRVVRKLMVICLTFMVICTAVLIWFRVRYHDAICSLAQTQVRNTASDLINDSIDEQIERGNMHYDRIVYFEKDLEGRITALKTNMAEVNRLKTDILNLVNDEILAIDTSELSIPLGNLILPELFSGKGPGLPVKIIAIRNSDGSFQSSFTEAGINQTLHKLTMEVVIDVSVLVMGRSSDFTVVSHVVVAETVLVGQVPDTFFHYGG